MQVETTEINGFLIDQFNQYGLEVGKKRVKNKVYVHFALILGNLKIKKLNVLAMIGNVVSVLVTIATLLFNYTLINVKVLVIKNMLDQ